ncbi:MAG: hypothetical protein ACK44D_08945 [Bacteroidia bacterium]|jgi:hypothetical protein
MFKHQRLLENMHIPMWLIKDTCWMLQFKLLGTIVAVPTISMALYLVIITRNFPKRFWPNMAVLFWISANSTWMLGEFYQFSFVFPAVALFCAGIIAILVYMYIILTGSKPQHNKD